MASMGKPSGSDVGRRIARDVGLGLVAPRGGRKIWWVAGACNPILLWASVFVVHLAAFRSLGRACRAAASRPVVGRHRGEGDSTAQGPWFRMRRNGLGWTPITWHGGRVTILSCVIVVALNVLLVFRVAIR